LAKANSWKESFCRSHLKVELNILLLQLNQLPMLEKCQFFFSKIVFINLEKEELK